jgi:hypothetical protein
MREDIPMTPRVFVGSASEAEHIDLEVRTILEAAGASVVGWRDLFRPGDYFLDALMGLGAAVDGALLIVTPDDLTSYRGAVARAGGHGPGAGGGAGGGGAVRGHRIAVVGSRGRALSPAFGWAFACPRALVPADQSTSTLPSHWNASYRSDDRSTEGQTASSRIRKSLLEGRNASSRKANRACGENAASPRSGA